VAAAEQDILEAGSALKKRHPDLGAVVLECTNMAPYARALSEHLQLPVFDIVGFHQLVPVGLRPRDFRSARQRAQGVAGAVNNPLRSGEREGPCA